MKNKKDTSSDSRVFWKMSKEYISRQLPEIRKASPATIKAYRESLNKFIDYLETEKHIGRADISFADFNRVNITDFLDWMLNIKNYAEKTCNLRITAIHALLEYAAYENVTDLMAVYLDACTVKGLKTSAGPIEYFEGYQMKALLAAPGCETRVSSRNQMMLILYYDTAARIAELLEMNLGQLHLEAEIPYLTILGKGRKYRSIPLMDKTIKHLKRYLKDFHADVYPRPVRYLENSRRTHAALYRLPGVSEYLFKNAFTVSLQGMLSEGE